MQPKKNNLIKDDRYLELLKEVEYSPIFIMGDHRTGTTLLYKFLVATEHFNYLSAYHIIKYNEILFNHINNVENQVIQELEENFKSLGISNRNIDEVIATPYLPEEYGFILKNVVGDDSCITPKNHKIFQQLCRKIQFTSDRDKPLLIKNPWDYSQFMYVKSIVPTAKFIFIHREPTYVINSKLNAARNLLSSWNPYADLLATWYHDIFYNPVKRTLYNSLYSRYFDLGVNRMIRKSIKSTNYFLENVKSIDRNDYCSVRYEDLCKDPNCTINKILTFLGLESSLSIDFQALIKPRSMDLLPEVQRKSESILFKLKNYYSSQGYSA